MMSMKDYGGDTKASNNYTRGNNDVGLRLMLDRRLEDTIAGEDGRRPKTAIKTQRIGIVFATKSDSD